MPIRNKVIALSDTSTIAEYATQVPPSALPPTARRLIFRMSMPFLSSFSLFTLSAQLTDHDGHVVTVNLSDPTAPGGPYLPSDGVHPHDRFVQVEIPIAQIPVGAFQLGRLKEIKLDFVPVATYPVALDDLRVE